MLLSIKELVTNLTLIAGVELSLNMNSKHLWLKLTCGNRDGKLFYSNTFILLELFFFFLHSVTLQPHEKVELNAFNQICMAQSKHNSGFQVINPAGKGMTKQL